MRQKLCGDLFLFKIFRAALLTYHNKVSVQFVLFTRVNFNMDFVERE